MEGTVRTYGYPIVVTEVLNGFIVQIGRELFTVSGKGSMEDARKELLTVFLKRFLEDREAWLKDINARFQADQRPIYYRPSEYYME